MPITFRDTHIPGVLLPFDLPGPESHGVETHFSGTIGTSEIRTGIGGRDFILHVLHHDGYRNRKQLEDFVHNTIVDKLQNKNGVLKIPAGQTGASAREFKDCTLRDIVLSTPKPPGTLITADTSVSDHGWHCFLALHFRQLKT